MSVKVTDVIDYLSFACAGHMKGVCGCRCMDARGLCEGRKVPSWISVCPGGVHSCNAAGDAGNLWVWLFSLLCIGTLSGRVATCKQRGWFMC